MKAHIVFAALAVIAMATMFAPGEQPASNTGVVTANTTPPQTISGSGEPGWAPLAIEQALSRLLSSIPGVNGVSTDAAANPTLREFERLSKLPAGDEAIALSKQIEAAISPQNMTSYVQALLVTENTAVERAAITALARTADAATIIELATHYGAIAAEQRGRILQVLEGAQNPEAVKGLADIATADVSEKRSPLMMSALYGIANVGTQDGVQHLLGQLSTGNAEYAVMALERVQSAQGIAMIRAAAEGSKDVQANVYQPALMRIAELGSTATK